MQQESAAARLEQLAVIPRGKALLPGARRVVFVTANEAVLLTQHVLWGAAGAVLSRSARTTRCTRSQAVTGAHMVGLDNAARRLRGMSVEARWACSASGRHVNMRGSRVLARKLTRVAYPA